MNHSCVVYDPVIVDKSNDNMNIDVEKRMQAAVLDSRNYLAHCWGDNESGQIDLPRE